MDVLLSFSCLRAYGFICEHRFLMSVNAQPPETTMGGSLSGPALTLDLTFMAVLLSEFVEQGMASFGERRFSLSIYAQPPLMMIGGSLSRPALTLLLTFMAALLPVSFFRHSFAEI
jgi:hypothetical protein